MSDALIGIGFGVPLALVGVATYFFLKKVIKKWSD